VLLPVRKGEILSFLSTEAKPKATLLSQVIATALKMKEGAFANKEPQLFLSQFQRTLRALFQILLFDN